MIRVEARVDEDGLLVDFMASGHSALGPIGSDIVCAAFSILARTAYSSFSKLPGALVKGEAKAPGSLDFAVKLVPVSVKERAIGITAFLVEGISGLAREFPAEIGWTMEHIRRI